MAQIRTFVAIDCPPPLRSACGRVMETLADVVDGVRWVSADNLHLTLKFLGEVEDRELHAVCVAVRSAVKAWPAFHVACHSVGAFPSVERPHTIWVDVDDADGQIVQLQKNLAETLLELGFPMERRPYKPHVTLGRTRSRRVQRPEWSQAVARYRNEELGLLPVDEVVVYSSELERRGPTYTALARCPLSE